MKGIFYSIMIALMLIPILSLIIFHSQIKTENIDISIRANELNYFMGSLETDLNKFIGIGGKRALIAAVSEVVTTGIGLDDAQASIAEMIENGTLNGKIAPLVDSNNLKTWETDVRNIAQNSGFELNFTTLDINVTQYSSFEVLITINVTVNISDSDAKMGIIKNVTGSSIISIENIEDPLFPLQTYGRVTRIIRASNVSKNTTPLVTGTNASGYKTGNATLSETDTGNDKILIIDSLENVDNPLSFGGIVAESSVVPDGYIGIYIVGATNATSKIQAGKRIYLDYNTMKVWDLSNLTLDLTYGYYHNSSDGASFLDRLEGNTTLSPKYKYGIETIINLEEFSIAGIPIETTKSCLDHRYWNDVTGYSIRNGNYNPVFDLFKIDTEYADDYGINELII